MAALVMQYLGHAAPPSEIEALVNNVDPLRMPLVGPSTLVRFFQSRILSCSLCYRRRPSFLCCSS
jgi:hypothetical protein